MAKKHKDTNGFLIPGCLLIGIGIGMTTGQVASYTLIGLGVGFVLTFLGDKK